MGDLRMRARCSRQVASAINARGALTAHGAMSDSSSRRGKRSGDRHIVNNISAGRFDCFQGKETMEKSDHPSHVLSLLGLKGRHPGS
eukprot:1898897-Pleurochrysis_carterae.AAC.2